MFLLQNALALGWDIMWRGMAGIFAAIAVIVVAVWLFTKIGSMAAKKNEETEE